MSNIINVVIKRKRLTSKQKDRANHNLNLTDKNQVLEDFFRISVFIPYIDYFILS